MSNNKNRLLTLLEILKRKSSPEHHLSLNEIIALLEEEGVSVKNRKTLYDDFKALSSFGYEIEYEGGYYLLEAPFSLSDIRILTDAVSSLTSLENRSVEELEEKLYSFVSEEEEEFLKKISIRSKHEGKHFRNRLEDVLEALKKKETLILKRKSREEEIVPLAVSLENGVYYLYYHYPEKEKIYHTRFDRIESLSFTGRKDSLMIPVSKVREHIEASTDSYYEKKARSIRIDILKDSEELRERLLRDFPNAVFSKNGCSIKASISHVFFAKIFRFGR